MAIKILSNSLEEADANFAERFKNEARAMAKLCHPGIVGVYDFGETTGGLLYIVMEFIEVLLNVVARDPVDVVVDAPPITGWKVDGQLESKPDGTAADGPVIPVSLTPGTHRISIVGKGTDGQPFQTDADVVVTPK